MKLSSFLNTLLVKARTRADKENVSLPSVYDILEAYVQPVGKETHFIQFSNVEKLGINPKYKWGFTPLGIYGYQLNPVVFKDFRSHYLKFQEYKLIHLFKWRGPSKTLLRIDPSSYMHPDNFEKCLKLFLTDPWFDKKIDQAKVAARSKQGLAIFARKKYQDYVNLYAKKKSDKDKELKITIESLKEIFDEQTVLETFWDFTKFVSGKPSTWNYFLRKFGINGIIDNGSSLISGDMDRQSVFLTPSFIEIVESFPNPTPTKEWSGLKKRGIKQILIEKLNENGEETKEGWVIKGDLNLSKMKLTKLPTIKFVSGDLNISNNQLTGLEGSPHTVGGGFDCSNNKLTSLKNCPQNVGGDFDCSNNQLISLIEGPQNVGGYVTCFKNLVSRSELEATAPQFFKK